MLSSNRRLGGLVLAVVLIPSSLPAQTIARSFDELQGMLTADEVVIVIDRTGQATKGKVAEVSAASLVLVTPTTTQRGLDIWDPGASRTFARNDVTQILRSDPTGTTGARMYLAEASDSQAPVAALGALSSRVKPSDTIYVRRVSGEEIAGRFSRASDASLTLEIDGRTREIPVGDVQQVSRRGGNRVKQGMLFGFLSGAAVGVVAMAGSDSKSDFSSVSGRGPDRTSYAGVCSGSGRCDVSGTVLNPAGGRNNARGPSAVGVVAMAGSDSKSDFSSGDKIFFGTVVGGGVGLTWGTIIGAFLHQRPVVYRAAAPTVRLMPVFAPGRAGVMLAARF